MPENVHLVAATLQGKNEIFYYNSFRSRSITEGLKMESHQITESHLHKLVDTLKENRRKLHNSYYFWLVLAVITATVIPIGAWAVRSEPVIALVLLCYAVVPSSIAMHSRSRIKDLEVQIKEAGFELDLQTLQRNEIELKAEKILRLSDVQLERYYGLNLSQNAHVFMLGVGCIFAGLLISAATAYAVIYLAKTEEAQIITGALGTISTLLVNFVAAVYLKLHTSASTQFDGFHTRLVQTHQILLAGVVASRIQDNELREKTLAELSLKVIEK